ncbi:MAG: LPS assembly protein LptD [Lentisphaeria bacterium]
MNCFRNFSGVFSGCMLVLLCLWPHGPATAQEKATDARVGTTVGDINVQADNYEFDTATGWVSAIGDVRVAYRGMILEADEIRFHAKTKQVEADGNVYFYTLDSVKSPALSKRFFWNGEKLTGNFKDPYFESGEHKVLAGAWYETGDKAVYRNDERLVLHDVSLSTCEYIHTDHEHYSLNATKVVYTPEGKIKAYNTWYKVGKVPVFYWPFAVWDTGRDGGNINYRLGYDDDWGGYVMASRRWKINENLDTTLKLDYRTKRGFAVGNRTERRTEHSATDLRLYALQDDEPPSTSDAYNRRFNIEEDRYRVNVSHWQEFGENLTLRLNLDVMSDIDFLEDWFEDDFDDFRQPRSYVDLRYDHERFTASLNLRPRLNDFYTVVERLPELRFDFPRQTVPGIPGLLYEGETSLADLKMNWREFDKPRSPGLEYPEDYESLRFDTLHMLYRPFMLGGGLAKFVPRAGLRLTYYEDTSEADITSDDLTAMYEVDDPDRSSLATALNKYDDEGGSALRVTGELGAELSTKFYRVWDKAESEFWQVDGLRHVIQPFLNYTYIPEPTEDRENLYFFDLTDRLIEQNFVRAGVKQRLQTRHPSRDEIYTLAQLTTYADFHFEKEGERGNMGDLGIVFEVQPRSQVRVTGKAITNMDDGNLNRAEFGIGLGDPDKLRVDIAYLFRDDYNSYFLNSMGSTLADYSGESMSALRFDKTHYLAFTTQFPMGAKADGYIRYEYDLEDSELARQIYQITRDLHCWMGGLRLEEEDGETQVQLVLYLKAFPSIGTDGGSEIGL